MADVDLTDLTQCPECGAPAEIWDRHVLESTDGPIEHVRVRCVKNHLLFMPAAGLADFVRPPAGGYVGSAGDLPSYRPARNAG